MFGILRKVASDAKEQRENLNNLKSSIGAGKVVARNVKNIKVDKKFKNF